MYKILHVTDAYAAGVRLYVDNLSSAQLQAGHHVKILALKRNSVKFTNSQIESNSKNEIYESNSFSNLMKISFRLLTEARNYDFIHLHSSRLGAIGRIFSLFMTGRVFLYTPHGYSFLRKDISSIQQKTFKLIETILSRHSNSAIICVGSSEFNEAIKLKPNSAFILRALIEPPSDLAFVKKNISSRKLRIGYLCRNTTAKDPDFFLHLAEKYSSDAEFVWIGASQDEFPPMPKIDYVTFLGQLNHEVALEQLSNCHALVVTSLWEGLPLNVVEAQILGVLVIIRNTIEIPELISHKETGLIFDSSQSFAEIIQFIFTEPNKISQIVLKAQENARNHFLFSENKEKWFSIYEKAKQSHSI